MHDEALDVLRSQSSIPDSPLAGVERTIHYLQNLGPSRLGLIFKHAPWVLKQEPEHILDMYGPDVKTPGTFAASCLLARRLAEREDYKRVSIVRCERRSVSTAIPRPGCPGTRRSPSETGTGTASTSAVK